MRMHINTYIQAYMHIYVYTYICIYIQTNRQSNRQGSIIFQKRICQLIGHISGKGKQNTREKN